jgi:large subunit ribosomal protein L30e
MADLNSDLRMAVDSGSVALGAEQTMRAITSGRAKLVVVSGRGNERVEADVVHLCGIAGIKVIKFKGNSTDLGAVCGKPHSVGCLAVIEAGNSNILKEDYQVL